jgi:hypothetical protein
MGASFYDGTPIGRHFILRQDKLAAANALRSR